MAITQISTMRSVDEHTTQVLLFDWLRVTRAPSGEVVADYAWMNPNGMSLGKGTAVQRAAYMSKMKRAGFKNGVADVTIAIPIAGMHGAYLELKRPMSDAARRRAVSDDQKKFLRRMRSQGYFVGVAAGFDQARAAIESYFRGDLFYALDAFEDLGEDAPVQPSQSKRKRSTTKPKGVVAGTDS
jgi:hypothetical protein